MIYFNGEIKLMNEELEKISKLDSRVQIYIVKNKCSKVRVSKNDFFNKIIEMEKK